MLVTLCCYRGADKRHILYFTLAYYLTLTITHSVYGISNMEVLTSNDRMSAITIFSLHLEKIQHARKIHLNEEGLVEPEEIEIPLNIIFFFSILLIISYGTHFNRHFQLFGFASQDFILDL